MKYHLLVDDCRDWHDIWTSTPGMQSWMEFEPGDAYVIVRTYEDAIKALHSGQHWDFIYLDHDLGGDKTGYDVINEIERLKFDPDHNRAVPEQLFCVSANPIGKQRILQAWQAIQRNMGRM